MSNFKAMELGVGAFAGAFFSFFFLRLAEGLTKIYSRHVQHYNSLIKLEFYLNLNFTFISQNRSVAKDFLKVITEAKTKKAILINVRRFEKMPMIRDEILLDLSVTDTINNLFSYNLDIHKLNTDFFTINRLYDDITKLSMEANNVELYLSNITYIYTHVDGLDKFLDSLREKTIKRASEIRVLQKAHKPLFTRLMFLILPTKVPISFDKKIALEEALLREEIKKTHKESKKEIDIVLGDDQAV